MPGRTPHFEIYGDKPEELAAFYARLFGWAMDRMEGFDYWRVRQNPDDTAKVDGGLTYRPQADPKGWLQFVDVDSIDASLAAAEEIGGRIVRPKTAVPRTAWVAVLSDPAGNMFAIWQPDPTAMPMPEPD